MGQSFAVGSPYNFQHSLSLSLPIFTGGSRWFNFDIQKNIRKSLKEELEGKEEETVLKLDGGILCNYTCSRVKKICRGSC